MNKTVVHAKVEGAEGRNDVTELASVVASNSENVSSDAKVRDSSISTDRPRTCFPQINKQLAFLKAALVCWYGGTVVILVFSGIFFRQRGLSVGEFSFILSFCPLFQLLGSTASGMLADKLGRGKPILFMNLFLTIVSANSMLFLPVLKSDSCRDAFIMCTSRNMSNGSVITHCDISDGDISLMHCSFRCAEDLYPLSEFCFQDYISRCDLLNQHGLSHNLNLQQYDSGSGNLSLCTHETPEDILNNAFCNHHIATECISSCGKYDAAISSRVDCQHHDEKKTFVFSFILILTFYTCASNCFRVFDFVSMSMVKSHRSHFGQQRAWSVTGTLLGSLLGGALVSVLSTQKESPRYDVVFFLFDLLMVVVIFAARKLDVEVQPPTKNILVRFFAYSKNIDRGVFLLVVLLCGTMWGFDLFFGSLYLEKELDASGILIGLNTAIANAWSIPFLFISHWFIKNIGSNNIILLALGAYTVHFIGFSYLTSPWLSLLYQPLGILRINLFWVAVVLHSHDTAPSGFTATAVSIAGALHYGAGRGTGSIVGGFIMSKYGGRIAYRVLGTTCAVTAVLYSLILYVRRSNKEQLHECRDSQENSPLGCDGKKEDQFGRREI